MSSDDGIKLSNILMNIIYTISLITIYTHPVLILYSVLIIILLGLQALYYVIFGLIVVMEYMAYDPVIWTWHPYFKSSPTINVPSKTIN